MKKLFASLFLAVLSIGAHAAADDVIFQQRNSTDTATVPKLPPHPTSGFGLMAYDGTALIINYLQVGPGLSVSGGVIDVVPAGAPTWASITSKPTTLGGYGITDAYPLTGNPSGFATSSSVSAGLAGKFSNPTGTTAQYIRGDGSIATFPAAAQFNYGYPVSKTVVTGTSYQAADPTKAATITLSLACANNSTLLAANPCTVQVRVNNAAATCSNGTVIGTNSATVDLGLVITQRNTNVIPVALPIGGYFIVCPTAGTFTVTAVEQVAG